MGTLESNAYVLARITRMCQFRTIKIIIVVMLTFVICHLAHAHVPVFLCRSWTFTALIARTKLLAGQPYTLTLNCRPTIPPNLKLQANHMAAEFINGKEFAAFTVSFACNCGHTNRVEESSDCFCECANPTHNLKALAASTT